MHNKAKSIKDLNIRSMLYLSAMVDNKFIPSNAALDIPCAIPGSVSHQMKRIEESFDFDVFVWGRRKSSHITIHPLRLTKKGEFLYRSVKWFLGSIDIEHLLEMEILK